MNKICLLFLLTSLSIGSFAQKCKYTVDGKDEFTGEKVNTMMYTANGWTWVSSKKGKKYFIDMSFMAVVSDKSMTTQDSMKIKLANGTILRLTPAAEVLPGGASVSTTVGTSNSGRTSGLSSGRAVTSTTEATMYSPTFEVDRSVYEQLSQSEITVIRFDFAGKPWDFHFNQKPLSKAAPVLLNQAKCILQLN